MNSEKKEIIISSEGEEEDILSSSSEEEKEEEETVQEEEVEEEEEQEELLSYIQETYNMMQYLMHFLPPDTNIDDMWGLVQYTILHVFGEEMQEEDGEEDN